MSWTFGKNYKVTLFGESHGQSIGVIIDGIQPGITLDFELITKEMNRRRPGKNNLSTPRDEKDKVNIQSGYFNDQTTGSALCGIINNKDTRSKDYSQMKDIMRPGHADYTGYMKYFGHNDYRGGGQFSGRLTASLCFAGAIAKQLLAEQGITVGSHIQSIAAVEDQSFAAVDVTKELLEQLSNQVMPVLDASVEQSMRETITAAKNEGDSVGGTVEGIIFHLPPGLGDPFFDSFESVLSHMLFSIPGIKGVEFGKGFDITTLKGSEANDDYYMDQDQVKTSTNNNGGILGGITTGMPVIFKVAMKPTPSIAKKQQAVNMKTRKETPLTIEGRHDPCIVPRALVVVEAVSAIVALDFLLERKKYDE
jgi:chorismate synthase